MQHIVSAQLVSKLEQRDVLDDAGKVDRSLDARIPTTNDCSALSFVQRAVAVRAIRHAAVRVLGLAGDTHAAPTCAGGDDQRTRLQCSAALQRQRMEAADPWGRINTLGALRRDDLDLVIPYVFFELCSKLWAFGIRRGNEVLDTHRVEELPTKAFGHNGSPQSLAGGVDRSGRTGRAAADDQNVERVHGGDFLDRTIAASGIDHRDEFFEGHTALTELFAVAEHRWYSHYFASCNFVLERAAIKGNMFDVRVDDAHQVERLHDVGAVLAAQ